ncbi:MAG: dipeptide/oligopeptide/nickel ABC transporter ATP-binding protein [Methanocorpusculum sp.]|nr:dipeptide/oligopeptide/nickel ABC transporter ATP-binding protein [Methanocorpusculum sp.]MDE2523029.1 dipeptide/oligopeptide/nickel ABC transporter ATP-binding protein [Methanocorpusculum sp.]MDE2524899.1 dipeptide/oligopeptide/nickel ABC transporter ATP-binding protein [Methanocorpusculum sp.]
MQPLLSAECLSKNYGHGDIFRDVSFTVDAGETIGLFGMSGSGKSTLGRCLIGLERLSYGRVLFEGAEVSKLSERRLRELRPAMQMLFQHPEMSMDPRMRLCDSVAEPLAYHEGRERSDVFSDLLPLIAAVGLRPDQFSCYPNQLSGGEIQRAMMVKIYSLSPKLIIADEPTSMLDMSVQAQILGLMKNLQKKNNTACVFISHDPQVMLAMCDRIGVLGEKTFRVMNAGEFAGYAADLSV